MSAVIFRVSAATILLGVVGASLVPYATSYVATSAVVNAPIINVRAPFDGVIVTQSGNFASPVIAGDALLTVQNSIDQMGQVLSITTSRDALSEEILGIETQIQSYLSVQVTLVARKDAEISARLAWFVPRLEEARAQIEQAQASYDRAAATNERVSRLSDRGLVNIDVVNDAETDLATSTADLAGQRATYARLIAERDVLAADTGVDLISTNLEQINERLDDVTLRLADLEVRRLERRSQYAGLNRQIAALTTQANRQDTFAPTAGTDGIIWEASDKIGASVADGEPIVSVLDCSRRFLEVTLPERHFERVTTGSIARVKFIGASETFDATVTAAYGSGARSNSAAQAVQTQIQETDGFFVIVELDGVDVTDQSIADSFCDVGRTAEVQFDLPQDNVLTYAKSMFDTLLPQHGTAPSTDAQEVAFDLGTN